MRRHPPASIAAPRRDGREQPLAPVALAAFAVALERAGLPAAWRQAAVKVGRDMYSLRRANPSRNAPLSPCVGIIVAVAAAPDRPRQRMPGRWLLDCHSRHPVDGGTQFCRLTERCHTMPDALIALVQHAASLGDRPPESDAPGNRRPLAQ